MIEHPEAEVDPAFRGRPPPAQRTSPYGHWLVPYML